jgi:hypothetical protein
MSSTSLNLDFVEKVEEQILKEIEDFNVNAKEYKVTLKEAVGYLDVLVMDTDGTWKKANSKTEGSIGAVYALAKRAGSVGQVISAMMFGKMSKFRNPFTAGAILYLNNGVISNVAPTRDEGHVYLLRIGQALDDGVIIVNIGEVILL